MRTASLHRGNVLLELVRERSVVRVSEAIRSGEPVIVIMLLVRHEDRESPTHSIALDIGEALQLRAALGMLRP